MTKTPLITDETYTQARAMIAEKMNLTPEELEARTIAACDEAIKGLESRTVDQAVSRLIVGDDILVEYSRHPRIFGARPQLATVAGIDEVARKLYVTRLYSGATRPKKSAIPYDSINSLKRVELENLY